MDDKWKLKIQRLLALAQSDNPHEAANARHFAEKLMKRHNIPEDEIDFVYVDAKRSLWTRNPAPSDCLLLTALEKISGAFQICQVTAYPKFDDNHRVIGKQYKLTPRFHGFKPNAELAAYSWDVLNDQVRQRQAEFKNHHALKANDLEDYAFMWMCACVNKLESVFGFRELTPEVQKYMKTVSDQCKAVKHEKIVPFGRNPVMVELGAVDGAEARLFTPAGETKRERLENHD